jgi:hypothetical protein
MLTLRQKQLDALNAWARAAFETRLAADLRTSLPDDAAPYDDPALRTLVDEAIDRARTYGLTSERDVALFCDLTLVLGPGFDTARPWAAEILRDPYIIDPNLRMDLLHARAMAKIERAAQVTNH